MPLSTIYELLSGMTVDADDDCDGGKVCDNALRVSRLRQKCSELSIKVPHRTSHAEGDSKYAFILTDDVHKASH